MARLQQHEISIHAFAGLGISRTIVLALPQSAWKCLGCLPVSTSVGRRSSLNGVILRTSEKGTSIYPALTPYVKETLKVYSERHIMLYRYLKVKSAEASRS